VRLVALTGMRAGEIAALRVGRVNPPRKTIEVAESTAEIVTLRGWCAEAE